MVADDVHAINSAIREGRPGVPLILMGHSWGSLVVQSYIGRKADEKTLDACVLSGTRGPGGFKTRAGVPVMAAIAAVRGQRKGSPLARALADGPYNKAFAPNRSKFDWLSRDEAEVDAYANDPLCGKLCSSGFYRDLALGLSRAHRPDVMSNIPRDLPIYIFCGSADPVGDWSESPTALVKAYRALGVADMEFVLYPGARHEPLNETNRDEVTANLLAWILRLASRAAEG
jgi:alpha-beta hydrolase superfamily lysophospholipase